MKITGIVPVRMESTRFPGKPLAPINGKPMLEIVIDGIKDSEMLTDILVATDSEEIISFCEEKKIAVNRTSQRARSGSERIAEIAEKDSSEIFVNIQGDEPMIEGWMIDLLLERMIKTGAQMATIVGPMLNEREYRDPNTVKAVLNRDGYALYFSRSPIPYMRRTTTNIFKHIGIYAYREDALRVFREMPVAPLEYAESLEQLRALENGIDILCVNMIEASEMLSVNSPSDIARLESILRK